VDRSGNLEGYRGGPAGLDVGILFLLQSWTGKTTIWPLGWQILAEDHVPVRPGIVVGKDGGKTEFFYG
jgi:hypothetical protein